MCDMKTLCPQSKKKKKKKNCFSDDFSEQETVASLALGLVEPVHALCLRCSDDLRGRVFLFEKKVMTYLLL